MRNLRTGTPPPEEWDADDITSRLKCDKTTAKNLMKEYYNLHGFKDSGTVEQHLFLDFIEQKQRSEREREARFKSDLANAESIAILKEQVKTLKEQALTLKSMSEASSEDARKARHQSFVANCIAFSALLIAFITLVLKLN